MFYEFSLPNNSSLLPQHYLKDCYIPNSLYLPWYIPWYGRDCNYWSVVKTTGFSNYLFSLLKLSKTFYWPFKRHTIFKNICSEAWPASATLQSNNGLKWWPCRGPPPQLACYPLCTHVLPTFSWKCDTTQSKNAFIENFFGGKYCHKPSKMGMNIFSHSDNLRVNLKDNNCFQDKPICRAISLHGTLGYIHRI